MKKQSGSFESADIAELARRDVALALAEDVGAGDLTAGLIAVGKTAKAKIIAREDAVLCGMPWVTAAFMALDPAVQLSWHVQEGQRCQPNQTVLEMQGDARALLTGERTALNFLQLLSAVATKTAIYVAAIAGTGAQIVDTRKTLPGLRLAQKYAVRTGGGANHRIGLYDAILIKENHIAAAGSIGLAVAAARRLSPGVTVEVEVENLGELREAFAAEADSALLDEFSLEDMRRAVSENRARTRPLQLEASGGVDLTTLRAIAETGVDFVSVGALTKHVRAVDLSMRLTIG